MQKAFSKIRILRELTVLLLILLPATSRPPLSTDLKPKPTLPPNQTHLLKIIQTKFDLLSGETDGHPTEESKPMLEGIHAYMIDLFQARGLSNTNQARVLANIIEMYRQAKELRSGRTHFCVRNKGYLLDLNRKIRCILDDTCQSRSKPTALAARYFSQRADQSEKRHLQAKGEA